MSILNMIASSLGGDWKTAIGTVSNDGGLAAYPNRVDFAVDREPTNFVIVHTSTDTNLRASSQSPLVVLIKEDLCLCAEANSQYQVTFVDKTSKLTIGKSNTNLYAKVAYGPNEYIDFLGTYTLFYV